MTGSPDDWFPRKTRDGKCNRLYGISYIKCKIFHFNGDKNMLCALSLEVISEGEEGEGKKTNKCTLARSPKTASNVVYQ